MKSLAKSKALLKRLSEGDTETLEAVAKVAGKSATPGKKALELKVADIEPNDWNPNVVDRAQMVKLKNGIKMLLDSGVRPPPIVVREQSGGYQIIDGFHRWQVFKELKQESIPAFILNVDDKTARILTDTLNYLRGRPDEQKYSALIAELVNTYSVDLDELSDLLPEDREELTDILAASDSGLKALLLVEEREREAKKEMDQLTEESTWVDVTFRVSAAQAKVIEKEIGRIEHTLDGKNRRGRALEYMAVMSSQTPLEQPAVKKKTKRKGD